MRTLSLVRRHTTLVAFSLSLAGSATFVACGSDTSSVSGTGDAGKDGGTGGGGSSAGGGTSTGGTGAGGKAAGGAGGAGTGGKAAGGAGGKAAGGAGGAPMDSGADSMTSNGDSAAP